MRVICTAGHVDHGKTTLVAALTGQQPDRLEEEQRRGLTIDLGFAWTTLESPSGDGDPLQVAFVDLPGHERFVPTMLAGAGPVTTALFVVSADEGWMPQSAEHLAILDLLDVSQAVVALTRSDLVDSETVEIASAILEEQLEATILAGAPIIPVSAVTGAGLDTLRAALAVMVAGSPTPTDRGRPRLWVDRSFSIRGAGTVVTGTLSGGSIDVGDAMAVQPGGVAVRVRGLQSLEQPVTRAEPGWRVAVNMVGIDASDVARGDALVAGDWRATTTVDVWCRPVGGYTLGRRGAWTAHVGSAATPAALYPIGGADLDHPGALRVEFANPLPLVVGDRLVLRESGRSVTAGGGIVLDPDPGPRVRGSAARQARLLKLSAPDPGAAATATDRLCLLVSIRDSGERIALLRDADAPEEAVAAATTVIDAGTHLIHTDVLTVWSQLAVAAVASAHQKRPVLSAIDKSVPRKRLSDGGCPPDVAEAVLRHLLTDGSLESRPGGVGVPGHQPRLTVAQQAARMALLSLLDAEALRPPPLAEAAASVDADQDLVDALLREGELINLPGLASAVTRRTMADAVQRLTAIDSPFTASQARESLQTTRKYALPLLEVMDTTGLTTRDGDVRRLTGA